MRYLAPLLTLLVACGGSKDSSITPPTGTTAGTTTSYTCTCRSAVIDIAITLDGTPTAPDTLTADSGYGPTDVCNPCTETSYTLDYLDDSCVVDATLGNASLQLRCEDFLAGPAPCVCGQDADLDFDFSSTTTAR